MNDRIRIFLWWRMGMNPINFQVACAHSVEAAHAWVAENVHFTFSKKRGVLYKKVGSKFTIYSTKYDEPRKRKSYTPRKDRPPEPAPEPLALPAPVLEQGELFSAETFKSIWRKEPPTKRRL